MATGIHGCYRVDVESAEAAPSLPEMATQTKCCSGDGRVAQSAFDESIKGGGIAPCCPRLIMWQCPIEVQPHLYHVAGGGCNRLGVVVMEDGASEMMMVVKQPRKMCACVCVCDMILCIFLC